MTQIYIYALRLQVEYAVKIKYLSLKSFVVLGKAKICREKVVRAREQLGSEGKMYPTSAGHWLPALAWNQADSPK